MTATAAAATAATSTAATSTAAISTAAISTAATSTAATSTAATVLPAWQPVCRLGDLVPERGVAALVDGEQVALFRLVDDRVLAVSQLDPFSGAHVISRGIVGSRGNVPTVASPMYKQVFDLRTGACLEPLGLEPLDLRSWPVLLDGDVVLVGRGSRSAT